MQSVDQLKAPLIDALLTHGDSLTHVKPGEYINIILSVSADARGHLFDGARDARQVISIQKSLVTDYKAQRLTLETAKQKVLQYNN